MILTHHFELATRFKDFLGLVSVQVPVFSNFPLIEVLGFHIFF
jgi:hypothetical protein